MGFDDRLWSHLVEEHGAHVAVGPATSTRSHPAARRGIAAGAIVLAAAVVGLVVFDQPSGDPAWTRQVIQRAAAVVLPPTSPNTILHVTVTETLSPLAQRAMASHVHTLSEEAWIQQGAPWGERAIVQVPGGPVLENSSSGQIYNATSDTLYPARSIPSGKPQYTLTPTGNAGSYRLTVKLPQGGVATQTVDPTTAQSLHDRTDEVQWAITWNGHNQQIRAIVGPSLRQLEQTQAQQPNPASLSFAVELRALLDSGHARVTRNTTADGQPAIEIASVNPQSGPQTNYYVSPQTYAPIELDSFGSDSPNDVTRVHIATYQTLPLAGHRQLLNLAVPPTARIDHTPADYWQAAVPRPF